jgi:hypothetical protein
LRDGEKRDAIASVAIRQSLHIRQSELADRAGNFEERDHHRTRFQQGAKIVFPAFERFEFERWSDVTGVNVRQGSLQPDQAR